MKKPYEAPKIFRIRLNHEQAILSTCSTTTASGSDGGTRGCKRSACRRFSGGGNDSATHS